MSLSPLEAFLSEEERTQLIELEKHVDALLIKDYIGGMDPIHFTLTVTGGKEPAISVLNALMERYKKAGWGTVQHVQTKEGRGMVLAA